MYCSITFKGRKGPQDPKMVKLEMIFYKTGYTRIPRVVSITGAYKCWNNETQSFESASSEYLKKNQLLLELKEKYMSVVERWEKEGRNFSSAAMGRLPQTQRRGKGKAGIESADRSPAHQRQN